MKKPFPCFDCYQVHWQCMEPGEPQNNELCLEETMASENLTNLWPTLALLSISPPKKSDSTIIDDIVTTGQSMGLEADADDIEKLLEDHKHRTNYRTT